MPSHIPIQKSCQNHSSANLGVESRSWIKAFPLQFGSISHFLCDAAAKFEVKALVPLSAPACPDRGLSTPVFRRLGARTIETSKPWLFGAIRKPTKSLPPLRARAIARDGEGATLLLDVQVEGAADEAAAQAIARTVCGSSLVKTAVHGHDPNWGRVVAAAGRAGVRRRRRRRWRAARAHVASPGSDV